jgi:succinate dehydrogenase hydrophobic anchor subunit
VAACIFAIVWWTVQKNKDMNDVIALVTACATLIGAIIGILKIITEYVFPREDEKYVTGIVESIQKNDLENKKTNMGAGMLK